VHRESLLTRFSPCWTTFPHSQRLYNSFQCLPFNSHPSSTTHATFRFPLPPSLFSTIPPLPVVDQDELRKLKEGIQHADEAAPVDAEFEEAKRHQEARDLAEEQAKLKAQAQRELLKETDRVHHVETKVEEAAGEVKKEGKAAFETAEKKGKEVVSEAEKEGKKLAAEAKQEGKKLAGEAKEKFAEGKEYVEEKYAEGKKDAKAFAAKAEKEIKKDVRSLPFTSSASSLMLIPLLWQAKKLQRKASEVEKEGRALAKQYPYAATGIVGFGSFPSFPSSAFSPLPLRPSNPSLPAVNFALIAVPAFYAYQNWHAPRWDRRIVSAVAVGLGAIFGAEASLGYFEVKKEQQQ
jgi:hypothetical protein